MNTVSIDIGSICTKVATFDVGSGKAALRAKMPSTAYITESGYLLLMDEAQLASEKDAVGRIDGLKSHLHKRLLGEPREARPPIEIMTALLQRIRLDTQRWVFGGNVVEKCTVCIPADFEQDKKRKLTDAAKEAGFAEVTLVNELETSVRHWSRTQPTDASVVIVCDIGADTTKIGVMQRNSEHWQPHPTLHSITFSSAYVSSAHTSARVKSRPTISAVDATFESLLSNLKQVKDSLNIKTAHMPLLITGGGSVIPQLETIIRNDGWAGSIVIKDMEHAAVLGSVEYPDVDKVRATVRVRRYNPGRSA